MDDSNMNNILSPDDGCSNHIASEEQKSSLFYKVGYVELSSYCKSLPAALCEILKNIDRNRMDDANDCLHSMMLGLGFVLDDIQDIDKNVERDNMYG